MRPCSVYIQLSSHSLQDGICLFHQPDIHICLKRILFLRSMFKLPGYNQFLEIRAASKEIMLFHDNGFVLLLGSSYCDVADDWKVGKKVKRLKMGGCTLAPMLLHPRQYGVANLG